MTKSTKSTKSTKLRRKNKRITTLRKKLRGGDVISQPKQVITNQKYINTANQGVQQNLQKLQLNQSKGVDHPVNQTAISNATQHATNLKNAISTIANHPSTKEVLGSEKTEKLQNLGDALLKHTTAVQQSIENGETDPHVKSALNVATKTATAMNKIVKDDKVQKHLSNTGSTLLSLGSNMFTMGKKYSQGKLSATDLAKGTLVNGALAAKTTYHATNAAIAAHKAANK